MNRNPLTKHILEAVKVIVKLKNNSQGMPTNLNSQNNPNALSGGGNSMANTQMQNMGQGGVMNMGIINSSINNPNMNQNMNKVNQPMNNPNNM